MAHMFISILICAILYRKICSAKVLVAGASGYIGRQVVKELGRRNIESISLVRSTDLPPKTAECLSDSNIVQCDVLDQANTNFIFEKEGPGVTICCLASRSGTKSTSWAVDYGGGLNLLNSHQQLSNAGHFVLLSAYCCQKPLLQYQFAKLKLENTIKSNADVSHSIVRPTAYFKSMDGQIESAIKGMPLLHFGDGTCAANAISDEDLAQFLVDCAVQPAAIGMLNNTRSVGGPDIPPITKRQQLTLIYDSLDIPHNERRILSLPLGIIDALIGTFTLLERITETVNAQDWRRKCEDAAEIARIIRYYATEPMVTTGPGEIQGTVKLADHFARIAQRGGQLEEIDKMTTTTGVLDLLSKNKLET